MDCGWWRYSQSVQLLLAVIGIYGVVSYSVAQRTSEFGLRVALGANPADVVQKALAGSLVIILAGLAAGIAGSLAMSKLLGSFLFAVSATDASIYGFLTLLLLAVALTACYIPARRAARVDPIAALRYE
jgi:putative ABC transport system permease protein